MILVFLISLLTIIVSTNYFWIIYVCYYIPYRDMLDPNTVFIEIENSLHCFRHLYPNMCTYQYICYINKFIYSYLQSCIHIHYSLILKNKIYFKAFRDSMHEYEYLLVIVCTFREWFQIYHKFVIHVLDVNVLTRPRTRTYRPYVDAETKHSNASTLADFAAVPSLDCFVHARFEHFT